ncbi:hypothetical protein VTL71DRAFT_4268 [Oculimacula yallundae]|uniref:Uncharacterized protein n=1 Tax=Oculimacula yallundae TaxID=86028 RepID=A0ABR4C5C0_9HELO
MVSKARALKRVCLDAENSADNVRAMLDEGSVLGDRVNKLRRTAVNATKMNQRRDVDLQQDLDEKFYWELVELAGGIMREDGRVKVSPIVKWTSYL